MGFIDCRIGPIFIDSITVCFAKPGFKIFKSKKLKFKQLNSLQIRH